MGKLQDHEHAVRRLHRMARECRIDAESARLLGRAAEARGILDLAEFLEFAAHHWDQLGVQATLF